MVPLTPVSRVLEGACGVSHVGSHIPSCRFRIPLSRACKFFSTHKFLSDFCELIASVLSYLSLLCGFVMPKEKKKRERGKERGQSRGGEGEGRQKSREKRKNAFPAIFNNRLLIGLFLDMFQPWNSFFRRAPGKATLGAPTAPP